MEIARDTAINRYIYDVRKIPRLTREQEAELCQRWRDTGDQQAKNDLVRANLRFVVAIALKYRSYGLPVSELIAEGNFGLLHAVDKFEPERGLRFLTYAAYWIRAYVLTTVTRSWSMVSGGSGSFRSKVFFRLRREKARVVNLVGEGDAALELLAERFETSRTKIAEMLRRLESRDISLDSVIFGDGKLTLVETLVSPGCNLEQAYSEREDNRRNREVVRDALGGLDTRERFIVEHRLMTDKENEMSLAEIGRRMGVSRERARQLETRAVKKLRQRIVELSGYENAVTQHVGSAA